MIIGALTSLSFHSSSKRRRRHVKGGFTFKLDRLLLLNGLLNLHLRLTVEWGFLILAGIILLLVPRTPSITYHSPKELELTLEVFKHVVITNYLKLNGGLILISSIPK